MVLACFVLQEILISFLKMPITVGRRLRAWRAAASRFTEYGLEVAAGAPMGDLFVAPVVKLIGQIKVRFDNGIAGLWVDVGDLCDCM